MRIAVVGAGGVGGYFGGQLAQAGHEVHFIARGAHLSAMCERGLRVESIQGDFLVQPVRATAAPGAVGTVELVVFAVKTWQLREAALAARPLVGERTAVLPLLNGIEACDLLAEVFGEARVLGGLCRIVAQIVEPGHIRHSAIDPAVVLGERDDRASERLERVRAALSDAGVKAEVPPSIQVAIWEKFMLIATWGGMGAVTRSPVGVWRSLPGTRRMAEDCLREIQMLARARGVAVEPERVSATVDFIDRIAPQGTASMQRDIAAGRPSELESLNGVVVRLGRSLSAPTPTHTFIYHTLLAQEHAARAVS